MSAVSKNRTKPSEWKPIQVSNTNIRHGHSFSWFKCLEMSLLLLHAMDGFKLQCMKNCSLTQTDKCSGKNVTGFLRNCTFRSGCSKYMISSCLVSVLLRAAMMSQRHRLQYIILIAFSMYPSIREATDQPQIQYLAHRKARSQGH